MKILPVLTLCLVFTSGSVFAQNKSIYTSTKNRDCRTLKTNPDEGSLYEGECKGVAGYKVRLIEGDLRQTLDIISPAKKKFELEFWRFFGGFSYIGEKIEWRLKSGVPVALIARFNVASDPDNTSKYTSHLIVSKVTKTSVCVTDILGPQAKQNEKARELADLAALKPCKTND